jgi:hypothetical protein
MKGRGQDYHEPNNGGQSCHPVDKRAHSAVRHFRMITAETTKSALPKCKKVESHSVRTPFIQVGARQELQRLDARVGGTGRPAVEEATRMYASVAGTTLLTGTSVGSLNKVWEQGPLVT